MHRLELETSWGKLRLVGGSRAGEGSILLLPQVRTALDAGRPSRALVPMQHVAISHGHLDHILGLPAWASQRQLQGMPGGQVYAPAGMKDACARLLALAAHLEGGKPYDVEVRGVSAGDEVPLRPGFALSFFRTSHWVETLGCRLDWTRRHLLPSLASLPEEELRRLRARGDEITEDVRTPLLAYLADTGPEVFDDHPWLADVEVLVMECTFLRPADRERARRFGHVHLDDVVALAPRMANRHLVLTHLSRRHRLGPGSNAIRRALLPKLRATLHTLNIEWD